MDVATTMIWLTADGEYLIEGEGYRLPDWAGLVRGSGGDPVRPAKFYLITRDGEVRRTFSEPIEYSIEDEIGCSSVHAVSGDNLLRYHLRQHRWDGPAVVSQVELAGLQAIGGGRVPFNTVKVVAAHEQHEQAGRKQRREEDERARRQMREELERLREALQNVTGRVQATWEFEAGGWVVKCADGSVLGRGAIRGYGRDVYRQVKTILRERVGDDFTLEPRLAPGDDWCFYPD